MAADDLSFFLLALVTSACHRIGPCPVHQHLRFVAAFTGRTGLQAAFFLLFAGRVRILVEESGGKEGCHSRALVVTGVANQPPLRLLPALAIRLLLDADASRTFAADGRVLGAAVGHRCRSPPTVSHPGSLRGRFLLIVGHRLPGFVPVAPLLLWDSLLCVDVGLL